MVTSLKTNYALRGALAFGVVVLVLFGVSINLILAALICGLIGGMAYHPFARSWVLAIVLGVSFGLIEAMFMLQDPPAVRLSTLVWDGFATAFAFWVVGATATLTLPNHLRSNAAGTSAVFGGLAGIAFQVLRGFQTSGWEHLVLWLIAGTGFGWAFGAHLDQRHRATNGTEILPKNNRWGVASVVCGTLGLGIGAIYFLRYELPLGLRNGFSPTAHAADWLWSWAMVAVAISLIGMLARQRRGRGWAVIGAGLALTLFTASLRIDANPWKVRFNTEYGRNLLASHSGANDPKRTYAVYTGNLILAQAALDSFDNEVAGRFLLEAAAIPGLDGISANGPDMSIASSLLQRGSQETVIEYLHRCAKIWPEGLPVLERWETAIRNGRRVNFNNRAIQQR